MDSKEKPDTEEKRESTPIFSEDYPEFHEKFVKCSLPEEKIRLSLDAMRNALAQEEAPRFKEFWDIRKICLPFFKENLNPVMRTQLWEEFVEISSEARRLKVILDEQSSFAIEQIDLALKAIESDMERFEELLAKSSDLEFEKCETLSMRFSVYNTLQKELSLLNAVASRINALRKEVLRTNMRIRDKNTFFKRMSAVGDRVFPKRKDLIKEISQEFMKDIDAFVEENFEEDRVKKAPFYVLREEIKALQGIAKKFTLNTSAFMHSREKLSKCWDIVKKQEKDRKKELSSKKQTFAENRETVLSRIEELKNSEESEEALGTKAAEIIKFMRTLELSREDVKDLKERLSAYKMPSKKSFSKETKPQKPKKDPFEKIHEHIAKLQESSQGLDSETLEKEVEKIEKEIHRMEVSSNEKDLLLKNLKPMIDLIDEKKEQAINEQETSSMEKCKAVLEKRKKRRQQIKNDLENYRKKLGGSGFDFEMALSYQEMIDQEKERLGQAELAIEEIEEKIAELEG